MREDVKAYEDEKFPNYMIVETPLYSCLYKKNEGEKKDNLIYKFDYGEKCSVTALLLKCLNKKTAESLQFMKENVHRNFWKDKDVYNAFVNLYKYQTEKVKNAYIQNKKSEGDIRLFSCIRNATFKKYEEFFAEVNKSVIMKK